MAKQPTKAELIAIINKLELQLAAATTMPVHVPSAQHSMDELEELFDHTECEACNGSGTHTSGGVCYRCKGKGYQDQGDVLRNAAYQRVRAKRTEIAGKDGYARPRDIPLDAKRGKRVVRIDGLYYPQ